VQLTPWPRAARAGCRPRPRRSPSAGTASPSGWLAGSPTGASSEIRTRNLPIPRAPPADQEIDTSHRAAGGSTTTGASPSRRPSSTPPTRAACGRGSTTPRGVRRERTPHLHTSAHLHTLRPSAQARTSTTRPSTISTAPCASRRGTRGTSGP
jgi:hypothetical protein